MVYILSIVLAVVSIVLLARPLFRTKETAEGQSGFTHQFDKIRWELDQTYDGIKTLNLEYSLGTIGDAEYKRTQESYRIAAARLLRDQYIFQQSLVDMVNDIEDKILSLRLSDGEVREFILCTECGGRKDIDGTICHRCNFIELAYAISHTKILPKEDSWAERH